jgi:transcriptional regulator with GAF, ATPase, and Fis domain
MSEWRVSDDVSAELVKALSVVARDLGAVSLSQDRALELIVSGVLQVVPGAEHAGVSMVEGRVVFTSRAPSDDLVRRVDELQSTCGEGPGVSASRNGLTVQVDDLAAEAHRWPTFARAAAACGAVSMLCFPLYAGDFSLGVLNVYSSRVGEFDENSRALGELYASYASLALGRVRQVEDLNAALASRDLIAQAKGILMERLGIDAAAAFGVLVRGSHDTNLRVVDVARRIADDIGGSV